MLENRGGGIMRGAPLGRAPFYTLDDGASLVEGSSLQIRIGLHAVEEDCVSLVGLSC